MNSVIIVAMKIVFLDESTITLGDIDFSSLKSLGEYESYENSTEEEAIKRSADADCIITNKVPIGLDAVRALKKLRLVTVIATGYNVVDLKAAKDHGLTVCNVPGYAADTVPQHAFALILNLATKAYRYHNDVMNGEWGMSGSFTLLRYPTFELAGKTIGIIGFGVIGRGVARIADAFGMRVLAHDASEIRHEKYRNSPLDTLLQESDVVTIHSPLTDQTRNMIDPRALSMMKKCAILINTARGGIVNEQALAEALNSESIAGAGVDVLTVEPPRDGNPLLSAKNIIITPHSAWSTREARQRLVDETAGNIRAFFKGHARNVVA